MSDLTFLIEAYQDWPVGRWGPIYPIDVRNWIIFWTNRDNVVALIGEDETDGTAKGLITYRRPEAMVAVFEGQPVLVTDNAVIVENLVVHPMQREKGYGTQMQQLLQTQLVAEGVTVAQFQALGVIAEKVDAGDYTKIGEVEGSTGKLNVGQVTVDTIIGMATEDPTQP